MIGSWPPSRTCAAWGQLVLCADDLHHADGDSLRVLTQLVESTRDLPLTLILARRPLPVRDQLVSLAARPEVLAAEVVPMDRAGLADLVRRAWGTAADASLLDQLAVTGGNPFHAGALLEQFRRTGPAAGRAETERDPSDPAVRTIEVAIRSQLALLDAPARDLLQILAVWGRPADVLDLAAIAGTPTGTTLRAVQAAVDSSIAGWTTDEHLGFSHDLYAEVIMADLAPGLRRLLHAACAQRLGSTGGMATEIAGHEGDADSAGLGVESAIRIATTDLVFAPEQAADLLAGVTAVPGSIQDGALAIARAGALAAAGRMAESKQVALGCPGNGSRRTDPADVDPAAPAHHRLGRRYRDRAPALGRCLARPDPDRWSRERARRRPARRSCRDGVDRHRSCCRLPSRLDPPASVGVGAGRQ